MPHIEAWLFIVFRGHLPAWFAPQFFNYNFPQLFGFRLPVDLKDICACQRTSGHSRGITDLCVLLPWCVPPTPLCLDWINASCFTSIWTLCRQQRLDWYRNAKLIQSQAITIMKNSEEHVVWPCLPTQLLFPEDSSRFGVNTTWCIGDWHLAGYTVGLQSVYHVWWIWGLSLTPIIWPRGGLVPEISEFSPGSWNLRCSKFTS